MEPVISGFDHEARGQKFFENLFAEVRNTIEKEDWDKLKNLMVPAKSSAPEMPKEMYPEVKEFLLSLYCDLKSGKVLKFEEAKESALLAMQTDLDDPNYINMAAHRFVLMPDGWKVSGSPSGTSFPREGADEENKARIEKEFIDNPEFRLASKGTGGGVE